MTEGAWSRSEGAMCEAPSAESDGTGCCTAPANLVVGSGFVRLVPVEANRNRAPLTDRLCSCQRIG